jgi:hypothetical protein
VLMCLENNQAAKTSDNVKWLTTDGTNKFFFLIFISQCPFAWETELASKESNLIKKMPTNYHFFFQYCATKITSLYQHSFLTMDSYDASNMVQD